MIDHLAHVHNHTLILTQTNKRTRTMRISLAEDDEARPFFGAGGIVTAMGEEKARRQLVARQSLKHDLTSNDSFSKKISLITVNHDGARKGTDEAIDRLDTHHNSFFEESYTEDTDGAEGVSTYANTPERGLRHSNHTILPPVVNTPKVRFNGRIGSLADAVDALYSSSSSVDSSDDDCGDGGSAGDDIFAEGNMTSSNHNNGNSSFLGAQRLVLGSDAMRSQHSAKPQSNAIPSAVALNTLPPSEVARKSVQALIQRKVVSHLSMISTASSSDSSADSSLISDCNDARVTNR